MVVLGIAILWSGFLLASWGAHTIAGDDVGVLDLAVPGHYKASPVAQ